MFHLRADIYSYGQLVAYTLTGKMPWQGRNSVSVRGIADDLIQKGDRVEIPERLSGQLMNVIQDCRLEEPEKRPTAETLVMHYYSGKRRPLWLLYSVASYSSTKRIHPWYCKIVGKMLRFDCPVDHNILLSKLKAYGVSGQLLTWLANYLSGWLQRVVIIGTTSQWAPVTSRVPQGSLLGPLLFIIFINNLPDVAICDVFTSLYADDTKVYRNINTIEDCMSMQKTLTNMDTWTQHNNIRFDASKCKALAITRKKSPLNFIYKLGNVELEPLLLSLTSYLDF